MNALDNLRVGTRLAVGFAAVVLLMVAIAVVAKFGFDRIGGSLKTVAEERYAKVETASDIYDQLNLQARASRNLLLMTDAAARAEQVAAIAEARKRVAELYDKLKGLLEAEDERGLFEHVQRERQAYLAQMDPFLAEVEAGKADAALERLLGGVRTTQLAYMKALQDIREHVEADMKEDVARAKAAAAKAEWLMVGAVLLGACLAGAFGWAVTRSVTRPVNEAVGALQRVAAGDLAVDVRSSRRDELGQLLGAVGETVASLRRVVTEVRTGVDSVTTASQQIAAGNSDLSGRTEQQASSLQETAASMEQLTGTVQQSAATARQADQMAAAARTAALKGGESVGQVVTTMQEISASSSRIGDIIGVIDGIAFQTNILALNAAVEAARAGEQGRGFAVVAAEVRTLAQRSAAAAKEIKTLIGASVERVEAGSRQVQEAGATMQEIVAQVARVTDLIGELTAAAGEQSAGIAQVNVAVGEMDRTTQQNAALVEESAAAAQSLAQQAQRLAAAVAVFRLDGARA
jgi:methyl-accepting chemotaxis protein